MKKNTWVAIIICIALTLLAIDGSTGWGWADYRPLRNFDYFGLGISWLLFIGVLIRDRIAGKLKFNSVRVNVVQDDSRGSAENSDG